MGFGLWLSGFAGWFGVVVLWLVEGETGVIIILKCGWEGKLFFRNWKKRSNFASQKN